MANDSPTPYTFFIDSQVSLLRDVLNRLVPATEKYPGAGDVGVEAYIDWTVTKSPRLKKLFSLGLPLIEGVAFSEFSADFASLASDQKDAVLRKVESNEPAFFDLLVRQTYNGYYTNPVVLEACGADTRPPQPRGFPLETGNLGLIENVKHRGPIYREV